MVSQLRSCALRNCLPQAVACNFAKSEAHHGEASEDDRARLQAGPRTCGGRSELRKSVMRRRRRADQQAGKKAVKKVGNRRKRVEKRLGR